MITKLFSINGRLALPPLSRLSGIMSHCFHLKAVHPECLQCLLLFGPAFPLIGFFLPCDVPSSTATTAPSLNALIPSSTP
jgi:hypothetical protein